MLGHPDHDSISSDGIRRTATSESHNSSVARFSPLILDRLEAIRQMVRRRSTHQMTFVMLAVLVFWTVSVMFHLRALSMVRVERVLGCPVTDYVAHTHNESCFDDAGNLVCPLPERTLHVHDESCYDDEGNLVCDLDEVATEHVHGPGCFETVTIEQDESPLTILETEQPTRQFEADLRSTDEQGVEHVLVTVQAEGPADALPDDAKLYVGLLEDAKVDDIEKAATQVVERRADGRVTDLLALDIAFRDEAGNEIEPASPMTMHVCSGLIAEDTDPYLVHFDDRGDAALVDSLTPEELEVRSIEDRPDELVFDAAEFSPYVIAIASTNQTLTAPGGESYDRVTVDAPAAAGVPKGTTLSVAELADGDETYEACLQQATDALGSDLGSPRLYDITMAREGVEVQPQGNVKVSVELTSDAASSLSGDVQVLHFTQDGPETLDAERDGDTISFETKGFSVFALVGTTIEKTVLASDGHNYRVSVTYGADADIPESADLSVEEVLPVGQDGSNGLSRYGKSYEEYVASAEQALEMGSGSAGYARLFDIKIIDRDDPNVQYQPADDSKVEVRVELADAESDSLSVVHFANGEEVPDVVAGANVRAGDQQGRVIEFQTEGFSVYVIINHEGEEGVVTPRVEFHFIGQDFAESGTSYTASPYNFVNTGDDYQTTQILKDGEKLEMVTNPPNITIDNGDGSTSEKFFYGWYVVNASDDTSTLDQTSGRYTGTITYTWPADDENKISFRDAMGLETPESAQVGDTVTWTIGNVSGTAELDEEGTAHVYLAPLYEDFYFVNFRMGPKEDSSGLANNILTRRLVVFGSSNTAEVHIGDVECPAPDTKHFVFTGWETVTDTGSGIAREYYKTVDLDGNEVNSPGHTDGYYITVEEDTSSLTQVDLYPVFSEARWLYFNTGKSGNGATYVGADYRITIDDVVNPGPIPADIEQRYYLSDDFFNGTNGNTSHISSRPGYDLEGWYAFAKLDADGNITNLTEPQDVTVNYIDEHGQPQAAVIHTTAVKIMDYDVDAGTGSIVFDGAYTLPNGTKLFEKIDGKIYFYKAMDDMTLYANWEPKQVDYTVVYWLQNADDDGYTLMHYQIERGVAGEQTTATEIPASSVVYTDNKLRFAHLSEDQDKSQPGEQSGIQQQYIEGDNSTIVNVYYDRDVYKLRFDIGFARTTNGSVQYNAMTDEAAASYSGPVYGLIDGNYVALTPDGKGGWTYAGIEYTRHAYGDYRYQRTTGTTQPQYGVVDNAIEDLSRVTGTVYNWQYNRSGWRTASANTVLYIGQGNDYIDSGYTTSSAFTSAPSASTYYIYNNNGYREARTNGSSGTSTIWTYNNGVNYGDGTRYLRVENGDSSTAYNLGFVDGAMRELSHDSEGWYYNTSRNVTLPYTGTLYSEMLAGTWTYSVSNITGPNYANGNNWDTFLTTTNNRIDLGQTNPFDSSEYTGTYTVQNGNTTYVVFYYDLTARYGETIFDRYPATQPARPGAGAFVGWLAQRDSFYNARLSTSIKGAFETISEDLILTGGGIPDWNVKNANADPNDYIDITVNEDNTITGEHGITQEFRCRYNKASDNRNAYLYRIYLADPETRQYPAEPTHQTIVVGGSGSYPNLQTPPTYKGYTLVESRVLNSNGAEQEPGGTYSGYTVPEINNAGITGNGMVMVFRLQPNEHTITYMYADNSEVDPGNSSRTYYYNQSIAGADIYTDTVVQNTPAGHEFAGWYENPDGIGSPFDFNKTMPDGDIILYAVYKPLRYRVQVDPNGGEIDHIDHEPGSTQYSSWGVTGFNRGAIPGERQADSGYNRSQATYINAEYETLISEYVIPRNYVPISDAAAATYEGKIYYYVNTQYHETDGSGLPSDCRNALYMTEDEIDNYYAFYEGWTRNNLNEGYITGTTVLDEDTWKALYVSKQKYRVLNESEHYTFLGWYKVVDGVMDSMPYNFSDPVTEPFTLKAMWRLDGGYTIQYVPEFTMPDGALVNGTMSEWLDPQDGTLSYADGAETEIYKQPTGLTLNGTDVTDDSVVFRGWQLVSKVGDGDNASYVPLEPGVYYDPDDPYVVHAADADTQSHIYFQAVYQYKNASDRRPVVKNLTLDANTGYINTSDSNDLPAWERYPDTNGINTEDHLDLEGHPTQIEFGDIQSSAAVHLYQYATELTEDASGASLSDAKNFFTHPDGLFLLGFDDAPTEGDYLATYPADSVIAITRDDNRTIYAVWEPMVYLKLENKTGAGDVSFNISSTSNEALEVINVKNGMYDRRPLGNLNGITLADGESITLAFPKGAEKDITISGTNTLGVGKVLVWDSSVELAENDTTYDTAPSGQDVTYSHNGNPSDTHVLVRGEANNTKPFSFDESLIQNEHPVTVTFRSRDNACALVLDDNYEGGGIQEYDYSQEQIAPEGGVPKSQGLPSTSTRIGYEFQGWAYSPTAETPDYSATSPAASPWTIPDLNATDGFFSEGTTDVDGTKVRTLYAIWKAKADAQVVYVYKDVPLPGNQDEEFDFTVALSGTYHVGNTNYPFSESGTFSLKHGWYAKITSSNDNATSTGHRTAYVQSIVQIYDADGNQQGVDSTVRWEKSGLDPDKQNGFRDNLRIQVSEAAETHYGTTVTRNAQTEANKLYLGESTDVSTLPLTVDTNELHWTNTDAGGTVVYTNTRETHDIAVEKVLHSNTSAATLFSYTASYTLDGNTVDLGSFTVQSGTVNTDALKGIPAGAVLTITEVTDANDNYTTTTSSEKGAADADAAPKTFSFTVTDDDTVTFDNTLKSYPVVFRLVDQYGNPLNGMFSLASSTGSLGSDLYANANSTNPPAGQFYASDTFWADTYTLTQTIIRTGYIGPDGPVTLTVTGHGIESSDPAHVTVAEGGNGGYIVTVINRATKKVTVKKVLSDPLLTSTRQFGFSYSYTPEGETEAITGEFTLAPRANDASGASFELTVPIDSSVTITEKTDGTYASVGTTYDTTMASDEYADLSAVTDPTALHGADTIEGTVFTVSKVEDDGTITYTNVRKTNTVTVKKVFDPAADATTVPFAATVMNGATPIAGYTVYGTAGETGALTTDAQGQVAFTLTHNGTQDLAVPYGAKLKVSEEIEGYTANIGTAKGATDEDSLDNSFTMTVADDDTVTFTNKKSGFPVVLHKIGMDSSTHTMVDDALGGATFTVYTDSARTTIATGQVEVSGAMVSKQLKDLTSADDGVFFDGLLEAGDYYLHETAVPDGYNGTAGDARLTVNADGSATLHVITGNTTDAYRVANEKCTVYVKNYSGVELPASGGEGTHVLYGLGCALVAGAAVFLLHQRRSAL